MFSSLSCFSPNTVEFCYVYELFAYYYLVYSSHYHNIALRCTKAAIKHGENKTTTKNANVNGRVENVAGFQGSPLFKTTVNYTNLVTVGQCHTCGVWKSEDARLTTKINFAHVSYCLTKISDFVFRFVIKNK